MKHLLTSALILIVGIFSWLAIAGKQSGCLSEMSSSDTLGENEVWAVDPAGDNGEREYYDYGDTLYQYDGKTVIMGYSDADDKLPSTSESKIMTYVGTTPVDSCRVKGYSKYFTDGSTLKFAIGVDTVLYDLRNLPDSIDPIRELLPKGVAEHRFSRSFALSDSSWDCDFEFNAFLPEDHPEWLRQFIAIIMWNDIQAMYLDNKDSEQVLKEYYSIKNKRKKIDGIDAATMTPKQIAKHFASEHERLYRKEFEDGEDNHGPKYDYMLEVAPAWSSADGRYVTYRFYSYNYTAGAHGSMEEYYLTFDNDSGRLLGYEDIIGKKNFRKAIDLLEKQLKAYHSTSLGRDIGTYPAAINIKDLGTNSLKIAKETFNGSCYPRPAITKQGIVFTYQPYEKGAFADGILHFVQPYSASAPILVGSQSK